MKVPRATSLETIEALLEASGRDILPLSYRFVQHRDPQDRGVPDPYLSSSRPITIVGFINTSSSTRLPAAAPMKSPETPVSGPAL